MNISKITVLTRFGTDITVLYTDLPTAYPELKYPTTMEVHARKSFGYEWALANFPGIEVTVINA